MAVSRRPSAPPRTRVPVFAATGADGWGPVQELRAAPEVRLVSTPRHAAVLLIAGAVPETHVEALHRLHDQLPHPRAVVGWRRGAGAHTPTAHDVDGGIDAVVRTVTAAHVQVLREPATSAPDLLPDEEPNAWRGVGPFGQGGEGMMGGTPYGRPMAMTGDDRDGLALDQLHLSLGPFLDAFPPGLVLDVVLQGDVVQRATPRRDAADPGTDPSLPRDPSLADARQGLRWLAHALHVAGLDALAARSAALAGCTDDDADRAALDRRVAALWRRVRYSGLLLALRGVGRDTATGDAAERWRRRVHAIRACLASEATGLHEPFGPREADELLERLLPGMTWTDALSTITSVAPLGHHRSAPAARR